MKRNVTADNLCSYAELIHNQFRDYNKAVTRGFVSKIVAPQKVIKSGLVTIVIWEDGTKTIVRRAKDTQDSAYQAFCAALAIKLFGSNAKLKRVLNKVLTEQKPKA